MYQGCSGYPNSLDASEKYLKWRNLSLIIIPLTLGFEAETLQVVALTKRKRISNEEEQLEKLQIEMDISKALRISLEKQILTKKKLTKFVE
ncbi:hypothetical protein Peur_018955 [Populus x canadensis]